ncbi:MAG: FAD-dependent oxidoreductase [Actinomycetota bacterium]
MRHDLVIIGGGIVGAAAAHHAATTGASVVLYDRADTGRATDAGAGIVGPALNKRDGGPQLDLAIEAARRYPALIDQLAAGGAETGYAQVGLLAVAVDDGEQAAFDRFRELVEGRVERSGHPTGHELVDLDAEAARARYPVLGPVRAAVLDTGAARVDGRKLAAALLAAAAQAGAEIRTGSVDRIDDAAAEADAVVIAGGAWSPAFGEQLGLQLLVEPQRGQIAHLAVPTDLGDSAGWPMLSQLSDQYQVSWPGNRVAVGATRETGSGFATSTTVTGIRSVLDEAVRVAPGLAGAALIEVRVGLRPLTPDLRPFIGRVPGGANVVVATGNGPTGLAVGPYCGALAVDLAIGRPARHDLTPFALDRPVG